MRPSPKKIAPPPKTKKSKTRFVEEDRQAVIDKGGLLPHEWLHRVASGEVVKQKRLVITLSKTGKNKGKEISREWVEEEYYPSFNERVDAAKNAAPYYAPRLAASTVKLNGAESEALTKMFENIAESLPV